MRVSTFLTAAVFAVLADPVAPGGVLAQSTTATGVSNALNPAISVNALFLGQLSDPESDEDGFKIQEVEMAVTAVVDPFFTAKAFIALEPDAASAEAEIGLEEVYVQTTGLPTGWGLRVGRFFLPFGRHNQTHTHQFPFITAPLPVQGLLGEESVGDVGVDIAYAPNTPWYLNLNGYVTDSANHLFESDDRALVAGGRLENLFDLSESTTLEFAGSIVEGPTANDERRTLVGADLRLKSADPRQSQGSVWIWTVEGLAELSDDDRDRLGGYTTIQHRAARRVWFTAGYGVFSYEFDGGAQHTTHEARLQLALVPSEFSALRAELGWLEPDDGDSEIVARLQFNFTVGPHPAHRY